MGGRGAASGAANGMALGRKMSVSKFLENLKKNNANTVFNNLSELSPKVGKTGFFTNGNAVEFQEAVVESGSDKLSVRFYNQWNPIQVTRPTTAIKQRIEVVHYRDGNVVAIYKLNEKSSKSLKNAEKNYHEMLNEWKKATHQKNDILEMMKKEKMKGMGGRGSSSGVSVKGKAYGTEYTTLHESGNIKFVRYNDSKSSKTPIETMTNRRVYVTIDNRDNISAITYYDEENKRSKQIDLMHPHKNMIPHTHHGYLHNENDGAKGAANLTPKEKRMVESVTDKWYNKRGK